MRRIKAVRLGLTICAGFFCMLMQGQTTANLTIHLDQKKSDVSPILYGLMTEEINHSFDGGLYGELVQNRTFLNQRTGLPGWRPIEKGDSQAHLTRDPAEGPSAALPVSMKVSVTAGKESPAGLLNEGYWGMAVRPNTTYSGSLCAKLDASTPLPLRIALVNDDSGSVLASAIVPLAGSGWRQYQYSLHVDQATASSTNHLELTFDRSATVWLQLVSLFPPTYKGRPNGNRIDLMDQLDAMHPSFLRFPGGSYLEGNTPAERYDWKKTVGPLVDRPTHKSSWGYQSSDGMGLLEFLEWCEDLHMEPVLAVFAGYTINKQTVMPGSDLQPFVQDALDEVEYVTGGPETKWGSVRARDGHPAPFTLQYIEIGNEDSFDKGNTYEGRFAQFMKGIKARYPALNVIATEVVKQTKPDVVDDHYYRNEAGMIAESRHYDEADRKGPKIFVGEWATREGTPTTNLGAALGDAAFMTGLERNSDLIVMASYAPLFVNVNPGGMQWSGDLIGYDALQSYGSPSYYAQVMFSSCLGDYTPMTSSTDAGSKLFYSVTASQHAGKACIKLVNASSTAQPLAIQLDGLGTGHRTAKVQILKGGTVEATNSIRNPKNIVPVPSMMSIGGSNSLVLPAYSIETIEVPLH